MPNDIRLHEFEEYRYRLHPLDVSYLQGSYAKVVEVSPTAKQDIFVLKAKHYVGHIALPTGGTLIINSKVGAKNLFYMLSHAWGLVKIQPPRVSLEIEQNLFEFIVYTLVKMIQELYSAGMYRSYIPQTENLVAVRGRILPRDTIVRNIVQPHRVWCDFSEHTVDNLENKLLAGTLRRLSSVRFNQQLLNQQILMTLRHFNEVSPSEPTEQLFRRVTFHRLNYVYKPVLQLCELIIENMTLTDSPGRERPLASFLINMNQLFEAFVAEVVKKQLQMYRVTLQREHKNYLDEASKIKVIPDILVRNWENNQAKAIIDTKYKRVKDRADGPESYDPSDFYQVNAYLDTFEGAVGVLIYPQWQDAFSRILKIRHTSKIIYTQFINLSVPTVDELEESCKELVESLHTIIEGDYALLTCPQSLYQLQS